jgi:hypothetical protein
MNVFETDERLQSICEKKNWYFHAMRKKRRKAENKRTHSDQENFSSKIEIVFI